MPSEQQNLRPRINATPHCCAAASVPPKASVNVRSRACRNRGSRLIARAHRPRGSCNPSLSLVKTGGPTEPVKALPLVPGAQHYECAVNARQSGASPTRSHYWPDFVPGEISSRSAGWPSTARRAGEAFAKRGSVKGMSPTRPGPRDAITRVRSSTRSAVARVFSSYRGT